MQEFLSARGLSPNVIGIRSNIFDRVCRDRPEQSSPVGNRSRFGIGLADTSRVRLLEWRLSTDFQIYSRLLAAVALNLVLNGLSFVE